jgi:hypothetical protein
MPAAVIPASMGGSFVAAVMIGVDPHKGSHTAVAIGTAEEPLGELRVRAHGRRALAEPEGGHATQTLGGAFHAPGRAC